MSSAGRVARSLGRIARTHYPGFVFGLPLGPHELPVFTYHDVEPAGFARDLAFLQENGYRTLSLSEFLAGSRANRAPERCVLLTFDDARRSFWEVALPLLRQFRARAVLFAPTGWIRDLAAHGAGGELFMSWDQLGACVDSGLVEVQSHAHRHALVFTGDELADFASPEALARFDIYDWPMRHADGADLLGPPPLGTPIYRAAPLLSSARRYLEDEDVARACQELVASGGGTEFFARPGWTARLRALHRSAVARRSGEVMPAEAFRELLRSEFELSRAAFQHHLGYAPTCLAYPWMLGTSLSLELARSAGIGAAFGVALDYRAARRGRLPVPVFGRLKCDWLRLLPGRGRASAWAEIGRKLRGFSRLHHLAH